MKYVVIDLEMNPVDGAYRKANIGLEREIIEIGAVILDDTYQEIGSFMTYVKPQYNERITRNIAKLTGITTSQVSQAPIFEDAAEMFFKWCDSINDEIQICQWSESDLHQFAKELKAKEYIMTDWEESLCRHWHDFQKEYDEVLGMDRQVSLEQALMYAGTEFQGNQHDALYDARNTGILLKTVRTPELCRKALDAVIDVLTPKSIDTSLGSMFDFSQFQISA